MAVGVFRPVSCAVLTGAIGLSIVLPVATAPVPSTDPELQVGIIQRFGDRGAGDTLVLQATPGDQLTVKIPGNNGTTQTVTTPQLKLEIAMQPLPKPVVEEHVVLSTQRSFETAEEKAMEWRSKGIEVELAQPNRWQVWAKRSVYKTPAVRRLLLQNLQSQGLRTAQIETTTLKEIPKVTFSLGNFQYTRDRLEISAGKDIIEVDRLKDDAPNRTFAGTLKLQPNAYGTYSLVNRVPLETYLRGVVPNEIGTKAPLATMEAQAILARTYALRNLRRFEIDGYQLCATTQCQVYYGLNGATAETDQAIEATRGLVLTYHNELVDAVYSSTTGGVTAPFHEVWRGAERPYLKGKIDAVKPSWDLMKKTLSDENNLRSFLALTEGFNESGQSNWFRWKVSAPLAKLNEELRQYLNSIHHPLADFNTIREIQVIERSYAGRVMKLAVQTDKGFVVLERDEVLLAFAEPNSMLFYLDPIVDPATRQLTGYTFVGGGLGHAVGLSQIGAYHLGKLGWDYERILSFYFPGAKLQPINPSITFWRDPHSP